MPKRKHGKPTTSNDIDGDVDMKGAGDGSDSENDSFDELPVEFEMFDPQPDHDFHGLKTLLRQLFDIDSSLFDISALADLILSQPLVGTTVKVDTNESDPYAFLTVLNINLHRKTNPAIETLVEYLLEKSKSSISTSDSSDVDRQKQQQLHEHLLRILAKENGHEKGGLGLILTERMINMPAEVVPPMYKMLQEEVQWALEDKEPYDFEAYLLVSKTYTEIASQLDDDNDTINHNGNAQGQDDEEEEMKPKAKKFKSRLREVPRRKDVATLQSIKKGNSSSNSSKNKETGKEIMYFHPEDEVIQHESLGYTHFKYTKVPEKGTADSKRTFSDLGIMPQGHMILFKKDKLGQIIKKLENTFKL